MSEKTIYDVDRAKFEGFGTYKLHIEERVNEIMEATKKEYPNVDNYLLWLCGTFGSQAQYVISGTGGGSIVPVTPAANPIEFEVSPTSYIPDGDSTKVIASYIGYNLIFVRGGITQSTIDLGGSYFSWVKASGLFTCYPPAATGELFQLYPTI